MDSPRDLRVIEKDGLGTLYNWRRRSWSIFVPCAEFQRHREQMALQKAAVVDAVRNWDGFTVQKRAI